jgi:hypothetical protein
MMKFLDKKIANLEGHEIKLIHCLGILAGFKLLNFVKNKIITQKKRSLYKRMISEYIS